IGLDVVRVPIGGNDFSQTNYSAACFQSNRSCSSSNNYTDDDVPGWLAYTLGDAWALSQFSIATDAKYLIPTLQAALRVNPTLQVIASPWTAPAWMKCTPAPIFGWCFQGTGTLDGGEL